MKRKQLIEWGIITVGLVCGYKFFEGVFSLVVQLFAFGFDGSSFAESQTIRVLVLIVVYAISFILLLRNSGRLAGYFDRQGNDEHLSFKIGKRALLQVILIGICISAIISKIDDILLYLFETFKTESGGNAFEPSDTSGSAYQFKTAAIQTILAVVVSIFSKDISAWFIRRDEADELVFDSETKQ